MAKRRPKNRNITISKAIEGHLIHCQAAAFSKNTLNDYQNTFRQLLEFLEDDTLPINKITADHIKRFMAFKTMEPISTLQGVAAQYGDGLKKKRSAKTLRNYHTALSSLWTWATESGYASEHIMHKVPAPKVHEAPIQPLSSKNVIDLLRSCEESRAWYNKPLTRHYRPTAERDQAIIALMVETAIRADELVKLRVKDINFNQVGGQVMIHEGKGGKSRWVPFSRICAKYLHEWLLTRDPYQDDDPLFINLQRNAGLPMTRGVVARNIKRLGKKVNVKVSPHKLRTTAACMMVRNGMSAWELQRIMGHSEVTTTMRYVRAAKIDLDKAMAKASPLDSLRM